MRRTIILSLVLSLYSITHAASAADELPAADKAKTLLSSLPFAVFTMRSGLASSEHRKLNTEHSPRADLHELRRLKLYFYSLVNKRFFSLGALPRRQSTGPVPRGQDWLKYVNRALSEVELAALPKCVEREFVRRRAVAAKTTVTALARKHPPPPRTTQEAKKRSLTGLTPFPSSGYGGRLPGSTEHAG